MRNLFFAILMALIYCGTIQAQEIVSTSSGPDGKISYVIALPAVTGYYDPFVRLYFPKHSLETLLLCRH
jgi:hypothetical protein